MHALMKSAAALAATAAATICSTSQIMAFPSSPVAATGASGATTGITDFRYGGRGFGRGAIAASAVAMVDAASVADTAAMAPAWRDSRQGALIGSALARPAYGYAPAVAVPVGKDAIAYCEARFRSYNPATGVYLASMAYITAAPRRHSNSQTFRVTGSVRTNGKMR